MADRNSEMDKLMHAIHMSDKFSFDQAALAVSVAFAKNSDEYRAVAGFYQNTRAQRSQVPLMNHINEGLVILGRLGASQNAMKAYCLHPLFQNDRELNSVGELYVMSLGESVTTELAMEYRRVANAYLAKCPMPEGGIKLSPIKDVNDMLIADKVQNRKDFLRYHLDTHPNSERLNKYFNEWLDALGVTDRYNALTEGL
jgi:hypothetical protein